MLVTVSDAPASQIKRKEIFQPGYTTGPRLGPRPILCKRIIEEYGGRIEVGEVEGGTEFSIQV